MAAVPPTLNNEFDKIDLYLADFIKDELITIEESNFLKNAMDLGFNVKWESAYASSIFPDIRGIITKQVTFSITKTNSKLR